MSDDDNGRPRLRLIGQPPSGGAEGSGGDGGPGDLSAADPTPVASIAPTPYPAGAWSTLYDLTGRVVLLTGHGDGLDDAIATGLADYGARMAIAQRDVERARATARISTRPGSQGSIALGMDSARAEHVRRGIGAVEQLTNQLDALVVIVDLGRASASRESGSGVSLGEMIHLVRAAERRMAVLGGGRILIVAGGTPRDPAVGAITAGAVAEFVRTTALAFIAQNVTVNGIVAALPVPVAPTPTTPVALPDGTSADPAAGPVDTVVDSLPQSSGAPLLQDLPGGLHPATDPAQPDDDDSVPADEVIGQAPVLPFPTPSGGPAAGQPVPRHPIDPGPAGPLDQAAPVVAAAVLFVGSLTTALTGQIIRIGPSPETG